MTQSTQNEIWFIHGANATPTSFNYLKERIRLDEEVRTWDMVDIKYDCNDKIADIVKTLVDNCPRDKSLHLVGHSLGGVIAVAMSQRIRHFSLPIRIKKVATMGSPLGGSESADYLRFLYPTYPLFKNITTKNKVISDMKAAGAAVPTLCIITTSGNNPLYPTANDGVVTVSSQRSLRGSQCIELPLNHFEVLLSPDTGDYLRIHLTAP